MKTLKFREILSKLILNKKKNSTWRLFDDKNISIGDKISFIIWETGKEFAQAKITSVKEATLGKMDKKDLEGHERFLSKEEMYKTYSKYYNKKVDSDSQLKIIRFKLL